MVQAGNDNWFSLYFEPDAVREPLYIGPAGFIDQFRVHQRITLDQRQSFIYLLNEIICHPGALLFIPVTRLCDVVECGRCDSQGINRRFASSQATDAALS